MKAELMRVAHLISRLEPGGAENHIQILSKEQVENGKDVFVIALNYLDSEFVKKFHQKVIIIDLSRLNLWKKRQKMDEFLRIRRIDIIHAHLPVAELFVGSLLFLSKTKKVVTRHIPGNFSHRWRRNYLLLVSRLCLMGFQRVIAISSTVSDSLVSVEKVKRDKISVVPYGIDWEAWRNTVESSTSNFPKRTEYRIVSIARLERQKRLHDLLAAFQKFQMSVNNAKLYIFGEGNLRKSFEKWIRQESLEEKIFLPGKTSNIHGELKDADVFILSSSYEGFGLVYLEAIGAGVPVISSRNLAAIEIFEHGYYFDYEIGDTDSLLERMLYVKRELNLNKAEILKNNAALFSIFSARKMEEGVERVYQELLSSH